MLFNSYEFLFGFLPLVFAGFFLIGRYSAAAAAAWLGLASLFFYGWWSIAALPLLVGSIGANYFFGKWLVQGRDARARKALLIFSVSANLAVLAFFKYANFFIRNVDVALGGLDLELIPVLDIVLPIGISFFTFTQIAFLVDCWQGKVKEPSFVHYLLFVSYFPHLIAGPVLHHAQMMPQFAHAETYRINYGNVALGTLIFIVGLSKKILLADPLGDHADALFKSVEEGSRPTLFASWAGVLAYAFQIYFDFSGYSDMAIGLSLLFGIRLPINFNSPYKATSIIDFWRRWHVSLSIFLRDYLYIPLGGNRKGPFRRYVNLLATMILGGLWHGANWTFILWGAAHGLLLAANHVWRAVTGERTGRSRFATIACWVLTFISVCFTWVLFRAESLSTAISVYRGMLGLNGVSLPQSLASIFSRLPGADHIQFAGIFDKLFPDAPLLLALLGVAFVITLGTSNMNSLSRPGYAAAPSHAFITGLLAGAALCLCVLTLARTSSPQFLYFQF